MLMFSFIISHFKLKASSNVYLRVRLVGGVKKSEDGKLVGGYKKFGFPSYVLGWRGGKVGGWKTFLFGWKEMGEWKM